MKTCLSAIGGVMAAVVLATAALAQEVILTVTDVAAGRSVTFTQEALLALPQTTFETSTIWTDGVSRFSGPALAAVLAAAEMPLSDLRISALNDYNVDFPAEKITPTAPVLTTLIDGAPFSVREKGPIWLLFPFDSDESFRTEDNFALSVWQLARIDVLPQ